MPQFGKEALSKFIGTDCAKQLYFNLFPDNAAFRPERVARSIPEPQPPRPGLPTIRDIGREWESAKEAELARLFGAGELVAGPDARLYTPRQRYLSDPAATLLRYPSARLQDLLAGAAPGRFLVEAQYEVTPPFEAALAIAHYREAFDLQYQEVRPDLIQVFGPERFTRQVRPNGDVEPLPTGDRRLQLRIIDIKLTSEPGPNYMAEVTYYAMTLAAWLEHHGLDGRYVVVPDAAIWPGSHEASALVKASRTLGVNADHESLRRALDEDLQVVPFEVFALRIRRVLQFQVPRVLSADSWQELPWYVDNRCNGCEYLGFPRVRTNEQTGELERTDRDGHCMPTARRQDNLSRVAFLTRGSSQSLVDQQVDTVAALAQVPTDAEVFQAHHVLRASRTVLSTRATALRLQATGLAPQSGQNVLMPRWASLHVYLSADFDQSTAVTTALGLQASWFAPKAFGVPYPMELPRELGHPITFLVDLYGTDIERRELLKFLRHIDDLLARTEARDRALREECRRAHTHIHPDPDKAHPDSTVQFYVWDTLQYDHLARIVGRHLDSILADPRLKRLAWLFPPDDLVRNPQLVTRPSAISVVREVVRAHVAVPVPHYYTLLEVAREYQPSNGNPRAFNVHPLFRGELSDQIPSERIHEIWGRSTDPSWIDQARIVDQTVKMRLMALSAVVQRLEQDLRDRLTQEAPTIASISAVRRETGIASDGQLWLAFARLNAALDRYEVQQIRAMPAHEREARFWSARLTERLAPAEEVAVLHRRRLERPRRRVYRLGAGSREVKLREGDFNFALTPEGRDGLLDQRVGRLLRAGPLADKYAAVSRWERLENFLGVTVVDVDRERGLLILDPDRNYPEALDDVEAAGLLDLSRDVMLDPRHRDFLTGKLQKALKAIGCPDIAREQPLVARALGQEGARVRNRSRSPAADLVWDAAAMHQTPVARDLSGARRAPEGAGLTLNERQWQAWEQALSRRLQIIWGPPGTGKSRTLTTVVLGAVVEALQQQRPLRVLISAFTYTAIDNVFRELVPHAGTLLSGARVLRLRSHYRPRSQDAWVPEDMDVEVNAGNPTRAQADMLAHLRAGTGVTVVAGTPEQVFNLLPSTRDSVSLDALFDLLIIDEASQMDVAHAVLPLCALAEGASVVLAGDHLQLPPIHAAEPPLNLEAMVGSIYAFCHTTHGVPHIMLSTNYRSNASLVGFARAAEYETDLTSHSPELRLNLLRPVPCERPADWPQTLFWTSDWARFLDPDRPAVAFVYSDGHSSQWNQFEADAVASLAWLLQGRLGRQLMGERHPATGHPIPASDQPYTPQEFWMKGIGVVTPHRAQQGLIVGRLQQVLGHPDVPPSLIRDAVDTVERFQGQQRDVIVASFALGDPDAIQDEEEFLMSLNRFNVLASRARAKLIVLVSWEVVDHLASEIDILRASSLLKAYVNSFCGTSQAVQLGYFDRGRLVHRSGALRFH